MDPHWPYNHHYYPNNNNNNNNNPPISYPTQTPPLTLPPLPNHQINNTNTNNNNNNLLEHHLRQEMEKATEFINNMLPLARIKKIMKTNEDVRMISAEAPVLLSKACEMFILELTLRSWKCTEDSKRRTLHKSDIASALTTTDMYDFLVDIVPRDKKVVVEKPKVGGAAALLPPPAAAAVVGGQGFYCMREGAGLNMGMQMDYDHDDGGGSGGCMEGGWPFNICNDDQPAWPTPMQRRPSQF